MTDDLIDDPERRLALTYAPRSVRAGLSALWALDARLAQVLATTSEPMLGQMRLTWWHDSLSALDTAPPPAEPLLRTLAAEVVARGVTGAMLARVVEGWEELIDPRARDGATLERYAADRGGGLFAAAERLLEAGGDPVEAAGAGWALVDLARSEGAGLEFAGDALAGTGVRWSRAGRPLGMLARLARRDVAKGIERQGSPARLLAMAMHSLTGR